MKKVIYLFQNLKLIFILPILCFGQSYSDDINLFLVSDVEEHNAVFISISDRYPLSNHQDSLAIPNLLNSETKNIEYFQLQSIYRERLLYRTKISEKDSVFVYDYSTDALVAFPVKKLNTVACLSLYTPKEECPCIQDDYELGFEIPKKYLTKLGKYYNYALVFIGKKNPFARGQMKAVVWKKINTNQFPKLKYHFPKWFINKRDFGQSYIYETDKYKIFIKDYKTSKKTESVYKRQLVVLDKKSNKLVNNHFFNEGESSSIAMLNNSTNSQTQWTGKLFKNKPEVIFGFEWMSFGCPSIYFLNSQKSIEINCDNRH